jgi:pimeloyl-ACP methyl ester carboxylesterase
MRRAGLKKHFLTITDDDDYETVTFCYCEKGSKVPEQPSIIFIHGFSSDKHTWSNMIKVNQCILFYKNKSFFFIYRRFLIVIIASLLICQVMEKPLDLMKKN